MSDDIELDVPGRGSVVFIPLREASVMTGQPLERARRDLRRAPRFGVRDGGSATAVKARGARWYVDRAELDSAMAERDERNRRRRETASEYENKRLMADSGTVATTWGSYTVYPLFHTVYNAQAAGYDAMKHRGAYSDALRCNTCWEPLNVQYGPYHPCGCHSCEDWNAGHDGTYPILSRSCGTCGWTLPAP
jgi:hypothetical protein